MISESILSTVLNYSFLRIICYCYCEATIFNSQNVKIYSSHRNNTYFDIGFREMLSSYDKYENEIMLKQISTNVHTNYEPFIDKKMKQKFQLFRLKSRKIFFFFVGYSTNFNRKKKKYYKTLSQLQR
jgi:hypothetical protein